MNHFEGRTTGFRVTRANIGTVATTEAIEHTYLHTEMHTLKSGRGFYFESIGIKSCFFFVGQYERTDTSVRANICTFITLDTVFSIPSRYESSHTAFFVFSSTRLPSTILNTLESGNLE